ncbi:MAG: hypothetical protein ABIR30_01325 [Chitinophagaceae bacterium]
MRIIWTLVLFVLVSAALFSCQKSNGDIPMPAIIDSPYLDRYIELDTLYTSGLDTLFKSKFSYDAQKRIVQKTETAYDYGTGNVVFNANEYCQYTGSDTVPYRVIRKESYTIGQVLDDTLYLFYDANNIITKDSVISYTNGARTGKKRITYAPNGTGKFIVIITAFQPNNNTVLSRDSIRSNRSIAAGNLTNSSDSSYHVPGGLFEVYQYNYNHDTKISPSGHINLHYPVFIPGVHYTLYNYLPDTRSINNPTTFSMLHWYNGNTSNSTGELKYTYNSNGRPSIIRPTSSGGSTPLKTLLFYRTL